MTFRCSSISCVQSVMRLQLLILTASSVISGEIFTMKNRIGTAYIPLFTDDRSLFFASVDFRTSTSRYIKGHCPNGMVCLPPTFEAQANRLYSEDEEVIAGLELVLAVDEAFPDIKDRRAPIMMGLGPRSPVALANPLSLNLKAVEGNEDAFRLSFDSPSKAEPSSCDTRFDIEPEPGDWSFPVRLAALTNLGPVGQQYRSVIVDPTNPDILVPETVFPDATDAHLIVSGRLYLDCTSFDESRVFLRLKADDLSEVSLPIRRGRGASIDTWCPSTVRFQDNQEQIILGVTALEAYDIRLNAAIGYVQFVPLVRETVSAIYEAPFWMTMTVHVYGRPEIFHQSEGLITIFFPSVAPDSSLSDRYILGSSAHIIGRLNRRVVLIPLDDRCSLDLDVSLSRWAGTRVNLPHSVAHRQDGLTIRLRSGGKFRLRIGAGGSMGRHRVIEFAQSP